MESPLPNSPYNTSQYQPAQTPGVKSYFFEFIQTLAVCLVIGMIIYWQIAQPHKVSGSSMVPTFHDGDYIITNKVLYKFSPPAHGDVIVLKRNSEKDEFIKRIIGVPGDTIKIQNGYVYRNNQLLEEDYLKPSVQTRAGGYLREGETVTVPEGQYLVFGDNRGNSSDSRAWGFITMPEIHGKVFLRYWPANVVGLNPGATAKD